MNKQPLPSQEELKKYFDYNPSTGSFVWNVSPSRRTKAGQEVGNVGTLGYRSTRLLNKSYLVHRLIYKWMTGNDPDYIDHINHNRSDNRWDNLRNTSNQQNNANKKAKGYYQNKNHGKAWCSRLMVGGKTVWSQNFDCPLIARLAYEDKHAEYFKEYSPYYTLN